MEVLGSGSCDWFLVRFRVRVYRGFFILLETSQADDIADFDRFF